VGAHNRTDIDSNSGSHSKSIGVTNVIPNSVAKPRTKCHSYVCSIRCAHTGTFIRTIDQPDCVSLRVSYDCSHGDSNVCANSSPVRSSHVLTVCKPIRSTYGGPNINAVSITFSCPHRNTNLITVCSPVSRTICQPNRVAIRVSNGCSHRSTDRFTISGPVVNTDR